LLFALILLLLLSMVANATPFFGASYTIIATTELFAIGVHLESFVLVVFVTAIGATLGKVFIYAGAKGLRQRLQKNKNVKLLGRWLGKAGFYVALFITALIPILPLDDYVYLGAGANNARLGPMLGVTFLAKLAKSAFEILLELSGIIGISKYTSFLGLSRLDLSIVLTGVFVVLGIIIYKIDWEPWVNGATRLIGRKPV
jgi:membrane protein YqaA with SNARE-associated domain